MDKEELFSAYIQVNVKNVFSLHKSDVVGDVFKAVVTFVTAMVTA
jgi:hypothetical protein